MRLQLQKTYGGDDRFKLTNEFEVSFKDANKAKRHIPDVMLGALSKREQEDFLSDAKLKKMDNIVRDTGGYNSLDEGVSKETLSGSMELIWKKKSLTLSFCFHK